MTRRNQILMACLAFGLILVAVGLIIGVPAVRIEGAYFDRANGVPVYAGVWSASRPGLLDPADGNLWLGAGVLLTFVTASLAIWGRLRQQYSAALPG